MINELDQMEDKSQCECLIRSYTNGHSQMRILVRNREPAFQDRFYLVFQGVRYFSGPVRWTGADFRLASDDECWERLVQLKVIEGDPATPEETLLRLYTVELGNMAVEIISSLAYVEYEDRKNKP